MRDKKQTYQKSLLP